MSDKLSEASLADWLVPFLLLGLWERDSYGHELAQRVADLGFGVTRPEVMYRTLRQMEKEGMVVLEHDGFDGGLSRRRYSITGSGEDYLEFWANSLERYQKEIDLFFKAYAG
jgi:PadR family transcriptional regulator